MASLRAVRRRVCGRKRRFDREADAALSARRLRRATTGEWIGTYRCSFCGGWHVGHKPKDLRQRSNALATDVAMAKEFAAKNNG